MWGSSNRVRILRSAAILPGLALVTFIGYECHANALTAGVLDLVLILLIAFRWGFIEGAIASAVSVASLDFFFMPPILSLHEQEPQDWIASAVFTLIALMLSRIAHTIHCQAIATDQDRARLESLFLTSRDLLLLDRGAEVGTQLTRLIEDIFKAEAVALWDARTAQLYKAGPGIIAEDDVLAIYFRDTYENDTASYRFKRVLRLGTRTIGALYIVGSATSNSLDTRSADAIASLAAIAFERAHSFAAEQNAEAARRTGQLRSTVLDGLAHSFKTPLATIQTASAGLMEIPHLSSTGKELVSLIEGEAIRLTNLTKKALETAELDEVDYRLDYEKISLDEFLQDCQTAFAFAVSRERLLISQASVLSYVWADRRLLQMALLQMVDNAGKYASPESAITLAVESTDSEIVFSVHNEGSYVSPEERLRIFDRFYRAAESNYKASGTGIGLTVTKRIVESHRGYVWVDSTLDQKTTFFFALPQIQREK
jgi:two-component system sensor histidine kinase KdpD